MEGHVEIVFNKLDADQSSILVARLAEDGYEGFWEEKDCLKAYIPESLFNENSLQALSLELKVSYQKSQLKPVNWNAVWEAGFEPVLIDDFVVVRALFHPPSLGVEQEVIITPKMSFGTGHHATTKMMVRLMRNVDWKDKTVLDFGTGTGVLAILAEKLGAKRITAIDNDPWSVENAHENAAANQCNSIQIWQDDKPPLTEVYDIILANINKSILLRFLAPLQKLLSPKGKILISGLLQEDDLDIDELARQLSLQVVEKQSDEEWIALKLSEMK